MEIQFANRQYNDHYDKLLGDDPFTTAVNKKLSDYWVNTGHELNMDIAFIEVLADMYNKLTPPTK